MPDRRRFVTSLAATCAAPALAQLAPNRLPAPAVARAPLLAVAGAEQPVRLEALDVDVEAGGSLARTRVRMTFFNPNARVLEGRLSFPLGDHELVTGFALDVGGTLRDAVPVEKGRAEQVFEAIARRGVDPGLLQRTAGNAHELRLYPLPPRGRRIVELTIDAPLERGRLPVALGYAERVERLSMRVRIAHADARPALAGRTEIALPFEARDGGWEAQANATWTRLPSDALIVRWSEPRAPVVVATERRHDRTYVALDVRLPAARVPRPLAERLQIVWDASGSAGERRVERELDLLDDYFHAARDVDVNLVRIADAAQAPEQHRVRHGDWRTLRRALEATACDGASNLADVRWDGASTEALWFTDGLANYGKRPWSMTFPVPVYAVRSASTANVPALHRLAEDSGGRSIDLTTSDRRHAARALLERGWQLVDAGGDGIEDVVVSSRHPEAGIVRLAAMLTAKDATLGIRLRSPAGQTVRRTVAVGNGATVSRLASVQWARLRLDRLEADPRAHDSEIRAIGRRFGLATSATSLIVLERVEDYMQHRIEPPAELRDAWSRLVAQATRAREQRDAERLALLVRRFEARAAWWSTDFPKDDPPDARPPLQVSGALAPRAPGASHADRLQEATGATSSRVRDERARDAIAPSPAASPPPLAKAANIAMPMARTLVAPSAPADGDPGREGRIGISLEPADPQATSARRIAAAPAGQMWAVYLEERRLHARSVAFFLDAAEAFLERGRRTEGLRVLSNLAEMDLQNRQVLRLLGYRLQQADESALAVTVFERVRAIAPHEPQSSRDLGLALAANGRAQAATEALHEVAIGSWDPRFADIDLIALVELNAIVDAARREGRTLDTGFIDPRLLRAMPLDLRVVLAWDADNTDVDLHVVDPNGEEVYYGHPRSRQGGAITRDATGGYGPEEFALRVAKPGRYRIEAQFFGHRQQVLLSSTGLMLWLSSGWGTPRQEDRRTTLRLQSTSGARVVVGTFDVPA
ncbi:MAG TPA: VIT domain-containing protein [Caldimonas sp.]|nr:VIT domain-containing protein [Caldimonas sp.]